MNLLALHELIASTGDGLHPDILRLLEERTWLSADPRIASLAERTPGLPVQAGPSPAGTAGLFVPGNVTHLAPTGVRSDAAKPNRIKA